MPGPIEYVKEHPVIVVGGIAAVIVLYLIFSGSGGSETVVQAGVDPALQQAQLALQGQAQQLSTRLAETQTQTSAAVAIAALQAQTQEAIANIGATVSLSGITAQRDVQLAGAGVQLAGISSQTQIAQYAQETNRAQIQAGEDIAIANAATYAHIAEIQGQTTIAGYAANTAVAQIAGNTATTQAWTSYWTAGEMKKAASAISFNNQLGSIVGGLGKTLALF